jgi:hypothetical protein
MTASADSSKISETSKHSKKLSSALVLIVALVWQRHFSIRTLIISFYAPATIFESALSMNTSRASTHFSRAPGLLSVRYFFH